MRNSETWCRHRTPFDKDKHPVCKAGVDYHQFNGKLDLMPCLGKTPEARAACAKYSGLTADELAEKEKLFAEGFRRIGTIRAAIVDEVKRTGSRSGTIQCPACETGTVRYSQASNGHVHARCSTKGCASWME